MARWTCPTPSAGHGEHIAADLPGGTRPVHHPPRRRLRGPVRLAEPRPAHRRRRRTSTPTASASPPRSGCPRERFAYGRQVHGDERAPRDRAARARAGRRPRRTGRRRRSTTSRRSSSPPTACRSRSSPTGAVAALHGGWRGLAERDRRRGRRGAARPRRGRPVDRRARPGGARLLLRGRRGGPRALRGLRRAGRRAQPRPRGGRARRSSRRPASKQVHDVGLCTMCADPDLFFSHRRDRGVTGPPGGGRMAGLITGLEPEAVRARPSGCARRSPRRRRRPAATRPTSSCSPRSSTSRSRSSARSPRRA